jgi:hypothetical protein
VAGVFLALRFSVNQLKRSSLYFDTLFFPSLPPFSWHREQALDAPVLVDKDYGGIFRYQSTSPRTKIGVYSGPRWGSIEALNSLIEDLRPISGDCDDHHGSRGICHRPEDIPEILTDC